MSTINGFGTMFYGRAKEQEDGSYITTEWITVAYIPVLPLRSLIVKHIGKGEGDFFTIHSEVFETKPIDLYKPHLRLYLIFIAVSFLSILIASFL